MRSHADLKQAKNRLQHVIAEVRTGSGLRSLQPVLPDLPTKLSMLTDPLRQQGNYFSLLGGTTARDGRLLMSLADALDKGQKKRARRLFAKMSDRARRQQVPRAVVHLIMASRTDERMLVSITVKDPETRSTYRFETGRPVEFRYYRNTEKAPYMGNMFDQDVEPTGKYMLVATFGGAPLPGWEMGSQRFRSPLVVEYVNTRGENGWKQRLSRHYGGKKKRALSRAIMRDGHDGIVTVDTAGNDIREVVALR